MSHKYGVERDKPRLKTHKRERLNRCNGQAFVFKHGEAKMNMPILPQFAENQKTIEIDGAVIRQDQYGRYCLNDLHKTSGGAA